SSVEGCWPCAFTSGTVARAESNARRTACSARVRASPWEIASLAKPGGCTLVVESRYQEMTALRWWTMASLVMAGWLSAATRAAGGGVRAKNKGGENDV